MEKTQQLIQIIYYKTETLNKVWSHGKEMVLMFKMKEETVLILLMLQQQAMLLMLT